MEIVIQAKQANNPSFSFLNKEDPLYPYYRHVKVLLQTGLFAYGGDDNEDNSRSTDGERDNKTNNLTGEDLKKEGNSSKIEENSTNREKNTKTTSGTSKTQRSAIM